MKLSRLFKTEVLFLPQVVVMVFPHLADYKDRGNQNRSISQMVTKSPPLILLPDVFLQKDYKDDDNQNRSISQI